MRCFSCLTFNRGDVLESDDDERKVGVEEGVGSKNLPFKELEEATENFMDSNMIGEGGFGCVYKGRLKSGMDVAVKQLNLEGNQGQREFLVEVLMLSLLQHQNLINLIGYCAHEEQRLLVYEFATQGSLENHIYDLQPDQQPLSWSTRMKVALGAARGLEYLHCTAQPPVIYRDLKSSNILLDDDFNAKLSDFGLAKLGPVGDNTHVSTRVMGTYGYCAPEYMMTGQVSLMSDIYSFGVVLLELITGRKAIYIDKRGREQNLVAWARPFMKQCYKTWYVEIFLDPLIEGRCNESIVCNAIELASMCLQDEARFRPAITDVAIALEYLASKS